MSNQKSNWINQYTKIHSSNFHEKVRQIFITDSFFKNLSCYQEVQVSSLVPGYSNNQHCVDWYIEELRLVIELHGEQHYKMVNFGNTPYSEASKNFHNIQYRDNLKKTSLMDFGYEYLEINYKLKSKLTNSLLKELIFQKE